MPRAAVLSIHARVEGTVPNRWEDPSLVQLWGPRFQLYVVAREDLAPFSLGRLPDDAKGRQKAEDLATRLHAFLDGRTDDLRPGRAWRRRASERAALRRRRPARCWFAGSGARAPTIWTVPRPDISAAEARLELARRYLHVFGPGTPEAFGWWAGIGRPGRGRRSRSLARSCCPCAPRSATAGSSPRTSRRSVLPPDRPRAARLLPERRRLLPPLGCVSRAAGARRRQRGGPVDLPRLAGRPPRRRARSSGLAPRRGERDGRDLAPARAGRTCAPSRPKRHPCRCRTFAGRSSFDGTVEQVKRSSILLGAIVLVIAACRPSLTTPADVTPDPIGASMTEGRFVLTFGVERATLRPGDPVVGKATLALLGPGGATITGSSSLFGFEFTEVGGSGRHVEPVFDAVCGPHRVTSNSPIAREILKSGAVVDGPDADWYRQFLKDHGRAPAEGRVGHHGERGLLRRAGLLGSQVRHAAPPFGCTSASEIDTARRAYGGWRSSSRSASPPRRDRRQRLAAPNPNPPVARRSTAPTPSPAPTPSVDCTAEAAAAAVCARERPCPAAILAVELAVAPVRLPIQRIVIEPGPFYCDVIWPGVGSPPPCYGPMVRPGQFMHAWVSFGKSVEGRRGHARADLPDDLDAPAATRPPWTRRS